MKNKKKSKYMEWLKLFPWESEDFNLCPECSNKSVDYFFIGCKESNVGHCLIWCNSCLKGINISRTRIPENAKFMTFGEAKEKTNSIPEFELLT